MYPSIYLQSPIYELLGQQKLEHMMGTHLTSCQQWVANTSLLIVSTRPNQVSHCTPSIWIAFLKKNYEPYTKYYISKIHAYSLTVQCIAVLKTSSIYLFLIIYFYLLDLYTPFKSSRQYIQHSLLQFFYITFVWSRLGWNSMMAQNYSMSFHGWVSCSNTLPAKPLWLIYKTPEIKNY